MKKPDGEQISVGFECEKLKNFLFHREPGGCHVTEAGPKDAASQSAASTGSAASQSAISMGSGPRPDHKH